jgi:hypothetical protein
MFFLGIGLIALFVFLIKIAWEFIRGVLCVLAVLMLILSIFYHAVLVPAILLIVVIAVINMLLDLWI